MRTLLTSPVLLACGSSLRIAVLSRNKGHKNLHMMIWLCIGKKKNNILLDVFLPVLICFFSVSVHRTILCQQLRINNEYKSNNPEDVAWATSTRATAGSVTLPLIRPSQRSHYFQIRMHY